MAEFAKRPEITVSTMGKVHNPTGEGVPAHSSSVRSKEAKISDGSNGNTSPIDGSSPPKVTYVKEKDMHETKVKVEGTARRNITRKKSVGEAASGHQYDSRNKKQGGAGKGKWSESFDEVVAAEMDAGNIVDEKDPLYDEANVDNSYVLTSTEDAEKVDKNGYDPIAQTNILGPLLTSSEFKIRLSEALREYFNSQDHDEFILSITEMRCKEYHPQVVKRAISIACDEGPRERELLSKLLCHLHPSLLTDNDMWDGFGILLDNLEDLSIDIPDVGCMVGTFLARAVVDEVLPPAFLKKNATNKLSEDEGNDLHTEVIEHAMRLLSREHCTARLEKVWGPGDGRPVPELKIAMDQLLKEYLMSRELDEAALCVKELNAPHFHHELVKRGVIIAMEEDGAKMHLNESSDGVTDPSIEAIAALIAFLVKNAILSESQVKKGVERLWMILDDVILDVPSAKDMLKEFQGVISGMGCNVAITVCE